MFPRKTANPPDGQGGQIAIQSATSELPEWLKSALYRGAAKAGLTETDPLWGCLLANGELLRAYLEAEAGGTKKSVDEIKQEVRELARAVQYIKAPETKPENVAKRLGIYCLIALALIGFGYFVCWSRSHMALEEAILQEHRLADARVARVIAERPADTNVFLDFVSHGGVLVREPIKPAPGHLEKEGFAMQRLQSSELAQPWIDTTGETAVMPIVTR